MLFHRIWFENNVFVHKMIQFVVVYVLKSSFSPRIAAFDMAGITCVDLLKCKFWNILSFPLHAKLAVLN